MKYQPFYCEENVWHLADGMRGRSRSIVFISNRDRTCAMWKQRAGDPVVWDYHVVLCAAGEVYDLDTLLPFPVPLEEWLAGTFPLETMERFAPRFRIVDGDRFLEVFASDRSHMKSEEGWRAPPPPWPPIGEGTNLMRFVDMETDYEGIVVDIAGLRAALG